MLIMTLFKSRIFKFFVVLAVIVTTLTYLGLANESGYGGVKDFTAAEMQATTITALVILALGTMFAWVFNRP